MMKAPGKAAISEMLLLIPNMIKLFYRLAGDPRVPTKEKAILLGVAAYVASPLDFLPDVVPVLGQVDDLLLVILILKRFMNQVDESLLYEYWDGSDRALRLMVRALGVIRHILPSGFYEKVVGQARRMEQEPYINAEYRSK